MVYDNCVKYIEVYLKDIMSGDEWRKQDVLMCMAWIHWEKPFI